jgi:branched-chain amino acid transport system substrate-binding protein
VIVALIVGLSACDQIGQLLIPAPTQMEGIKGEIRIGLSLPLTGRFVATYGYLPMQQGFELAREEINDSLLSDTKITFIAEDDRGTVEGAVEAFNRLIYQAGVPAILGPGLSSQAQEVFPIAQRNRVVAFSPNSGASGLSAIGDFVFRAALTTDVLIPSGIKATQEKLGYQQVATIYDETDLYSIDSDTVSRAAFADNGIKVLTTETFQTGNTDFSEQLTRIKESNPDAIFISALSPDISAILIQGRQLGIPNSVSFIIPDLPSNEIEAAGDAAEGAITFTGWTSTADTPGNQAFIQNYRAKYDIEPNIFAAQSYAAVYILAAAIAEAESTDPIAIRDALANTKNFDTVLGQFSFNVVGDAVYAPIVLLVQDGEFQIFE